MEAVSEHETPGLLGPATEPSRACFACNSRKIRCDKKEPCSACTRAGRSCGYPPSGPRIRRTRRAIFADMTKRISTLEKSLVQARSHAKQVENVPTPESVDSSPLESSEAPTPPGRELLVHHGTSTQYFNESFITSVLSEEQDMKSVMSTPREDPPQLHSPFNALGILSSPSPTQLPHHFHPPSSVAHRLLNMYNDTVQPSCSAHLLHRPTDEIKVYSTIQNPAAASFDNLALSFSLYFSSAVSLNGPEAQGVLGQDKMASLWSFKMGIEQSFAHGNFLDRPTVTGLNALSIYIAALRLHNHGKGIWILNGLALRIAQSLGLHRDGEQLGLPPFQAELHRRLWWQLVSRESRAGEDYGLRSTKSLSLPAADVKVPLNIEDSDLYPGMKQLPPERPGWTPMTFPIIKVEFFQAQRKVALLANPSSSSSSSPPPAPPSETVRLEIMNGVKARLEARLKHCNPVIPQQRLVMVCARQVMRKLDFITRQEWSLLQPLAKQKDFATDENLIEALTILDARELIEDNMLSQYSWAMLAYPQYHLTMYVLWHLCVKPEGRYVDQAWEAVESELNRRIHDDLAEGQSYRSTILPALKAKAKAIREKVRKTKTKQLSPGTENLDREQRDHDINTMAQNFGNFVEGDGSFLSLDTIDWSSITQDLQFGEGLQGTFWQPT